MWHLTGDTWHLKPDTWHQTSDRWHVVGGEHSSKFQLSSYHGSGVMMLWRFWRKSAISDFISDGGDCRTAPATPGLLIKKKIGSISCCYIGSQEVIPCWPRTSSLRNRIRTRKPIPHCTVLKYDRWYVDTWHVIPPMSVHPSLCPSVCPPPKKVSYIQKKVFFWYRWFHLHLKREAMSPDIINVLFLTQALFLAIKFYPKMCVKLFKEKLSHNKKRILYTVLLLQLKYN